MLGTLATFVIVALLIRCLFGLVLPRPAIVGSSADPSWRGRLVTTGVSIALVAVALAVVAYVVFFIVLPVILVLFVVRAVLR